MGSEMCIRDSFISGYTSKVAGTEAGVTSPTPVFSACFGAPFLPLHPSVYAEMLGKKMAESKVKIWMINTGWTGGSMEKESASNWPIHVP